MADSALYVAVSAMDAAMKNIEVRTNNIANINSTAYKQVEVVTRDLFYNTLRKPGGAESENVSERPSGLQIGTGSKVTGTYRVNTLGDIRSTNNNFDIAILGRGYFPVIMPNGERGYTRAGNFIKDNNGRLTTQDGYPLDAELQDLTNLDPASLVIDADGSVRGSISGGPVQDLGNIVISNFPNENGLEIIGNSYYIPTVASGEAVDTIPSNEGSGRIGHKMLEMSNVSIGDEYASFMAAQLAYQTASSIMHSINEILKKGITN